MSTGSVPFGRASIHDVGARAFRKGGMVRSSSQSLTELGADPARPERDPAAPSDPPARSIRRLRRLPAGRAVVGALLLTASIVGVYGAYLDARSDPDTRYLVASTEVLPGTRLSDADAISARFEAVALELAPELAERTFLLEDASSLIGRQVVAPLAPGELLTRSVVVADGGVPDAETVSFPIASSAALDGAVRVGERIDVLATYRLGEGYTAYVLRGVPVLAVGGEVGSGLGGSGRTELVLTVAVSDPRSVQALVHAVQTAEVVVARSTGEAGRIGPAPEAYQPSPMDPGPEPDRAGLRGDEVP